ncbi:ABC transporter substrate-binding protein [Acholeplasma equirhinis]|uniref:siderophore ABC transporter substrate-binding protein n=1 Tax=Acholeplasma equirhinis TaxID=555393 RepID=UPI00197AF3CF|nr:ABC transporter substrate-binding protein [Acholeplasma equirhinis]MBN3491016.1 ABC transporter substrate-binding protein [Acholeplasma equirhinis]
MKKIFLTISLLIGSLLVVACSLNFEEDTRERVAITHTVTKVTIVNGEEVQNKVAITENFVVNPKVVAVFAIDVVDMIDAIGLDKFGIDLLGIAKSNLPSYLTEFNDSKYPNVGTLFEPNEDQLTAMMPDLIIIGGRSASLYDSLKADYPYADVLDLSNSNYSFEVQKQVFENIGKVFPAVKEDLESYEASFEASFNEIKTAVEGKNALFLLVNGSAISVFGAGSRYGALYEEFGFMPSDPNVGETTSHGNIVSYEYVSAINPEVIFLMDRGVATGGSAATDQVINNPLITGTSAGQNGLVITLNAYAWYITAGGIQATQAMIDDIYEVFVN